MKIENIETYDIADERTDIKDDIVLPKSSICDHFTKNTFTNNESQTKNSKYSKAYFSEMKTPIIKNMRLPMGQIKYEVGVSNFKNKTKEPQYHLTNSAESHNCRKAISYNESSENINLSEENKDLKKNNQEKKLSQFHPKKKFIVDDYSFYPEMLISFHQIPSLPNIPHDILSKYSLNVPTKPVVSSDKTLILDLDETLITEHPLESEFNNVTVDPCCVRICYLSENSKSIENELKFVIRPYVLELLETLSNIYEIIIYTASSKNRTIKILEGIDPTKKLIHHIFTRENCFVLNKLLIKDIRLFSNRDMKKTIIIEDNISCFFRTIRNGVFVPAFDGSKYDTQFKKILDFLFSIRNVEDVREHIHEKFHLEEYWERYKFLYRVNDPA